MLVKFVQVLNPSQAYPKVFWNFKLQQLPWHEIIVLTKKNLVEIKVWFIKKCAIFNFYCYQIDNNNVKAKILNYLLVIFGLEENKMVLPWKFELKQSNRQESETAG